MTAGSVSDPDTPPAPPSAARGSLLPLALFMTLVSVAAILGGYMYFRNESNEVQEEARRQLELIAQLKQEQLEQWRAERRGDGEVLLTRNAESVNTHDALAAQPPAGAVAATRAWLAGYITAYNQYDRAYLLDANATVRIAVAADATPPATALIAEAREAMRTRQVQLVDFYPDDTDGNRPFLGVVSPVLNGPGGDAIGVVILRIDPATFVWRTLESEIGSSASGETELIRRDGPETALVLSPARSAPQSALALRLPAIDPARLSTIALSGRVGLVNAIDHRGIAVLASVAPVRNSPWVIVTHIDSVELRARLQRHLWLVSTGVILLILSFAAVLALWRHDQRMKGYQRQAELSQAVRDGEERLRLALSSASQGLYDLNLVTGTAIVSPEYATMLGHDPGGFVESFDGWRARLHPDDVARTTAALDAYLAGTAPGYHVEFRLRTAGGGWKWILSAGQIVARTADGRPLRMLGTHTDITQLKWAQEGQARATAQLRNLLAHSPTIVYSLHVIGGQPRLIAISENVERILGYTPAEVMQPDFWAAHAHPDDRDRAQEVAAAVAEDGRVQHEYRFRRRDGSWAWIQDQMTVVRRDASGVPLEMAGAWSDITQQHAAEQAMRDSEERLRLAMSSARQGFWDLDLATGRAVTSPEYAEMIGYDPDAFDETSEAWNQRVHPADLPHSLQVFDDYLAGRRDDYDLELRQRHADGRWVWIHSVGRAVERDAGGRPTRMIGIHTDVTARKTAELAADQQARLYRTLSLCNEAIVRSTSADELFPQVCRAGVDAGVVDMAWVALVDPATGVVRKAAASGVRTDYLDGLALSTDPSLPGGHGPVGRAIRENAPFWFDDVEAAAIESPLMQRIRQFGWAAMAAVPLTRDGVVIGALAIYSTVPGRFDEEARRLLTAMAADVSFALDGFERENRRREAEERYRRMFEDNAAPIVLLDRDTGAVIAANPAAGAFYGRTRDEMCRLHARDLSAESPVQVGENLGRIASMTHANYETRHRLASGEVRDVEVLANTIEVGNRPAIMGILNDITARKEAERRVERLSQLYLTLSRCNEAIVRAATRDELLPQVCRAAVDAGGFHLACVAMLEPSGTIRLAASHGAVGYLDGLERALNEAPPDADLPPMALVLRTGVARWVEDFQTHPYTAALRERAAAHGIVGGALLPLRQAGEVVGFFAVYTAAADGFDAEARKLLTEMAADISFALDGFARNEQQQKADVRLRQSESRYRSMFAESGVPMLLIDRSTGQISDANRAAAAFYGWDVPTLRRMHIGDINTMPADRIAEVLARSGASARLQHSFQHRLANGELRDVDAFSATIVIDDQPRILVIITDVTARNAAERALIEKEHELTEAQRLARVGSWTLDPNGRNQWSEEMFRLFGLEGREDVPSLEEFMTFVHPDDRPTVIAQMESSRQGQPSVPVDYRIVRQDGAVRYVNARGEWRHDASGQAYLAGTVQDVTDLRASEAALRIKDRAIESSLNAVAIADLDGRITYVNEAFAELWAFDGTAAVIGRSVLNFWQDEADAAAVVRAIGERGQWSGEMRATTQDGRTLELLVSAVMVAGDSGRPVCMVGAFVDITARKHAEQTLVASLQEKEALLKEVHHRVKNNLQVISSLLRLELGRTNDVGVKSVLGEMQGRIASMALLHETLYRADNLAHVDLSMYLNRLVNQVFRSMAPASGRVALRVAVEPASVDLEQAVPCGLLVNELVSNSLKHAFHDNAPGDVCVELAHVDDGPTLRLVVSDTGPGLPANLASRRDQTLGLQLVSDLARQLRGALTVGDGPGTRFTLVFTPRLAHNGGLPR